MCAVVPSKSMLVDIQFLMDQFMVVGFENFTGIFDELATVGYTFLHLPHTLDPVFRPLLGLKTASIPVNDQVIQYQGQRQTKFALVKPRKL